MTHSRVPFKSHKLAATPDPATTRPPPAAGSDKRLSFADLLRQRRSSTTAGPMPPPSSASPDAPGGTGTGAPLDDRVGLDALTDSDGSGPQDHDDRGSPDEQDFPAELAVQAPAEVPPQTDRATSGEVGAAATVQWSRADERRVAYVVDTVARFCNDRAVANSDGWQVSMKLRPDVLPETVLHLGLSPHWLLLRFDVRDEQALALVFSHRQQLVERLEAALDRRRDISITFS